MLWSEKTVVFDMDGTLVDTAPDLHAALCHAFSTQGMEAIDLPTLRSTIGHGARAMIEKSAAELKIELTANQLETLHLAFLDYYRANMTVHTRLFDGMDETLNFCLERDAKMAICTNKTQALAEQVLSELNLSDKFVAVLGADKTSEKKPSAVHLKETVSLAKGKIDQAVMIGDSSSDGLSAQAADMPFIFMTYGYPDAQVDQLKPFAKLDTAKDLPAAIQKCFS